MKPLLTILFLLALGACNNSDKDQVPTSENDVDAARNFIRAALDGNWEDARKLMVPDSVNMQLLDLRADQYQSAPREQTRSYREASITIYDTRPVNDSVSIVTYANSYKKQKDSLKVVRLKDQWLVDLQYTFPATRMQNVQ